MIHGHRVLDMHVHMQPWQHLLPDALDVMKRGRDDSEELVALQTDPRRFEDLLQAEGVDAAVCVNYVSPRVMGFPPAVNDWIADYCRGSRILIPMGSVHPDATPDVAAEVERLLSLGIRMLKIHPAHQLLYPHDERYRPLYEIAERRRIPVTIHTGTSVFPRAKNRFADPIHVDDVAADHPKLPILVAHAGRPLWSETAFFLARRHANVHLEISGIPPQRLLRYLPRLPEIAHRCVWGTDWPSPGVRSLRTNVEELLAIRELPDQAKRGILWDNGAKLLGLATAGSSASEPS